MRDIETHTEVKAIGFRCGSKTIAVGLAREEFVFGFRWWADGQMLHLGLVWIGLFPRGDA